MKSAYERGKDLPPFKLAFSSNSYRRIQAVLPQFETAISEHRNSLSIQAEKNKDYQKSLKRARLYISHFIQVVNMAIMRGELTADTRNYFGLDHDESKVPSLNSEEEVITWGRQLIHGEQARRNKGMNPVTNPTIAVVKVHYDKFLEYYYHQKSLKNKSQLAQDLLNVRRSAVDGVIQQVWNEVENTYGNLPEETRREKATEYGLIYVFRKTELNNATLYQSSRAG